MDLDAYQENAVKTAIYPKQDAVLAATYCALGLNGEAGEVADLLKKWIRDGKLDEDLLIKELGDVLWYLANLCEEFDFSLSDVAAANLRKLADRKARGTLRGSGDER